MMRQKLPKVNQELALKLMEEGDEEAELASRKKKGKVGKTSVGSGHSLPLLRNYYIVFAYGKLSVSDFTETVARCSKTQLLHCGLTFTDLLQQA